jgi:hypothetical protein
MRAALRQKLIDSVSELAGRVYEPHAAGPNTQKPYAVLVQAEDQEDTPWAGYRRIIEVWPYVSRTSFQNVDTLAEKIEAALDKQLLTDTITGEAFSCFYLGTTGSDVVDQEWDAITRGLRFEVFSLAWMVTETTDPDPVTALRSWAEQRFPDLQTDPLTWRPSDERPALYWRLAAFTGLEMMNWGAWINARMVGHLLAPKAQKRVEWLKKIVPRLGLDRRTYLSDGSPLFFESVSADSTADPFRIGQIQVMVRYGVLGEVPNVPALNKIHLETEDGTGGVIGG